jgi:DNA topoisomerase-3
LLDDVVLGKQEMIGAIDAVCEVAQRIIGKLTESSGGGQPLLAARGGASIRPPTSTMKRYADNLTQASAGVGLNLDGDGRKTGRKPTGRRTKPNKSQSKPLPKRPRKASADAPPSVAHLPPSRPDSATDTPLRIPYGNKAIAFNLGARYRPGGWYAPPGVDLAAFGERGWL